MKNLFKALLCAVIAIAAVIPLAAANVAAADLQISRKNAEVPIGYSVTIKVTGSKNVKWSSSDESIVTVKADGASAKLTGKKAGSATVSAKVGETTLKCSVTVKKSFITADTEEISIAKGKSKTVTFKVTGSKDIALSNSDKDVCSASWGKWDGKSIKLTVKAKKNGTAVITVYAKGSSKSTAEKITVTVGGNEILTPEEQVAELVNKERTAKKLSALEEDDELNKIAAIRAKELAEKYSHTRPDGRDCFSAFEDASYSYMAAAENIAYNFDPGADGVMEQWMKSKGHKANILKKDITKIGVGCCEADGRYYWVQVFAG